jgi:hypothetical protein
MIRPTTSDKPPFHKVNVLFLSKLPSPPAGTDWPLGAPIAVYPAPELDKGNSAGAKSKAEETE